MPQKAQPPAETNLPSILEHCVKDTEFRIATVCRSHFYFFHVYFGEHIEYNIAPFQREIFKYTTDPDTLFFLLAAFRGSAKSTICTLSLPIWAVLGKFQRKFILIVGRTQEQAKQLMMNIQRELLGNELLKKDLGPFRTEEDEWRRLSFVFGDHDAKIMGVSTEQSIRGLKHGAHRPDLIICDDLEDTDAVRTQESRDHLYQWVTGELFPAGHPLTRTVIVGNILHEDCLIKRLSKQIAGGERDGKYLEVPLLKDGRCQWPSKYPDNEAIERERRKIGNEKTWMREFLLDVSSDEGQIVDPKWITYYDVLPEKQNPPRKYREIALGVDLAFSKSSTADYTAIVPAFVYGSGKSLEVYILPHIVNERLTPLDSGNRVERSVLELGAGSRSAVKIFVEDMGAQRVYVEQWVQNGFQAESVSLRGMSKADRLALAAQYIQNGVVRFPRTGAEKLIHQMLGFGMERHDDLVDAFSILLLSLMTEEKAKPGVFDRLALEDWIILDPLLTKMEGRMMVWRKPISGQRYTAVCDTTSRRGIEQRLGDSEAEAEGGTDYSVIQIWDLEHLQMVAMFRAKWPYAKLHEPLMEMAREYNDAYIIVEATDHGLTVLNNLERNFYPQWLIHKERVVDSITKTTTKKMGFYTNSKTLPLIIDHLAMNIEEGNVRVHSSQVQSECLRFVIHDDGRPGASEGYKDNCVMAMAIATYPPNVSLALQALDPTQVKKSDLGL